MHISTEVVIHLHGRHQEAFLFQSLVCNFAVNQEVASLLCDTKHPVAHVPRPDFRSTRFDGVLDLLSQRLDSESSVHNAILDLGTDYNYANVVGRVVIV